MKRSGTAVPPGAERAMSCLSSPLLPDAHKISWDARGRDGSFGRIKVLRLSEVGNLCLPVFVSLF